MSVDPASPRPTRLLIALAAAGIATFGQLYALQGLLPQVTDELGVPASASGLIISAATLGVAVSLLFWAAVASRIGLPRAMSIALITASSLGLLVAAAPDFPAMLALRLLEGVALGGVPALAVALAGRSVAPERRAMVVGVYIAGTTVGGLAGRLAAGGLAAIGGWRLAEIVVCAVAVVCSIVFTVLAPRTPVERATRELRLDALRRILPGLFTRPLVTRYAQAFLMMGTFISVYSFLAFRLQLPPFLLAAAIANLVFLAYLAGTVTSSSASALGRRFGRTRVFLAAIAAMLVALAASLTDDLVVIALALTLFTGAYFLAHTIASTNVVLTAGPNAAAASSFYNIALYVGSAVIGGLCGLVFAGGAWPAVVGFVGVAVVLAGVAELVARGRLRPVR